MRRSIYTLAPYVARNGPIFEALARERHAHDPPFAFLRGGEGAAFYQQQVCCLLSAAASWAVPFVYFQEGDSHRQWVRCLLVM